MKTIKVTRKKKFAGALMPYWIITQENKTDFMARNHFKGDSCEQSDAGFPVSRIDIQELDRIGTRIMNGQTVELELSDETSTLFVSTMDGYLSNEISIDDRITSGTPIVISTKGGFKNVSHPVID